MRVLVVAAHPDDEVLLCGGTLYRYRKSWDTEVLILAENSSRHGDTTLCKRRAQEAQGVLCYGVLHMRGLPDQRLTLEDVLLDVESAVHRHQPDLIITHCREDLNRDHRIVNEAVYVASRAHSTTAEIWEAAVPGSNHGGLYGVFRPNTFVGLDMECFDRKIAALTVYREEVRQHPHPRSIGKITSQMRVDGSEANEAMAEAFNCTRKVL
jgi:LmbE family N-acetylglucosaminyl deacetylase